MSASSRTAARVKEGALTVDPSLLTVDEPVVVEYLGVNVIIVLREDGRVSLYYTEHPL